MSPHRIKGAAVTEGSASDKNREGFGNIANLGLRLMIVCLVSATFLAITYSATSERIAEQEKAAREESCSGMLCEIDAVAVENPEITESVSSEFPDIETVYEGKDSNDVTVAYVFIVQSKGYKPMESAVAIDMQGKVIGVEVIKDNETPGVGNKVTENEDFMGQFKGSDMEVSLGKDIDAVSGVTYTSKGVVEAVNTALRGYEFLR